MRDEDKTPHEDWLRERGWITVNEFFELFPKLVEFVKWEEEKGNSLTAGGGKGEV